MRWTYDSSIPPLQFRLALAHNLELFLNFMVNFRAFDLLTFSIRIDPDYRAPIGIL